MTAPPLTRILYAEDDPNIRAIARVALERVGGFEVTICGTGEEAVQATRSFKPDLVLLDVMMPGMDGPATLRAIRQLPDHDRTPIVFLTAKVMKTDLERLIDLGADGIVVKPFDPVELPSQILGIWDEANRR